MSGEGEPRKVRISRESGIDKNRKFQLARQVVANLDSRLPSQLKKNFDFIAQENGSVIQVPKIRKVIEDAKSNIIQLSNGGNQPA